MIKYWAVKFGRPNSVRLPIQYPHRPSKSFACPSLQPPAWQIEVRNHKLSNLPSSSEESFSSRISFSLTAQYFLSLSPVFVPVRHPK